MKRLFPALRFLEAALLCSFLSAGCAALNSMQAASPPIEQRTETELVSPQFSREALRAGGITILAMLTNGAPEGMRQNAAYEIFQGLRTSFPDVRVVPRASAVENIAAAGKIVSADKEKEYVAFVRTYEERRSMDLDQLKEWARLEGTRYILIGEVYFADKRTDARMMQTGEASVAGRVTVFSSGPNMVPEEVHKRVAIHGEIWDSLCGRAVWIGKSVSEITESSGSERVRVEDIFISAGRGLSAGVANAIAENKGASKTCREKETIKVEPAKELPK